MLEFAFGGRSLKQPLGESSKRYACPSRTGRRGKGGHEILTADHRPVVEAADFSAQRIRLRELFALRQHFQRILPRDALAELLR